MQVEICRFNQLQINEKKKIKSEEGENTTVKFPDSDVVTRERVYR